MDSKCVEENYFLFTYLLQSRELRNFKVADYTVVEIKLF